MHRLLRAVLLLAISWVFFLAVFSHDALAQGDPDAGKALWENRGVSRCRDCHGAAGEGGFGPDLAGRRLSLAQFMRAVRNPWGIMPAYPSSLYSDQEIANLHAYLTGLPGVAEPGPWRTPLPGNPSRAEELLIAGIGCAQCHGAAMGGPRTDAGSVGADFEWFKTLVYEHSTSMPELREDLGQSPGAVRMGNYSRARLPENLLEEIFHYLRDDLGFLVAISSRLTPGTAPGTYELSVENEGRAGRGLTAEDVTVTLVLEPGTTVTNATPAGYQGVRNDPQTGVGVAIWRLPRLGPEERQTYTITTGTGGAFAEGHIAWARPRPGSGEPNRVEVAMPTPGR